MIPQRVRESRPAGLDLPWAIPAPTSVLILDDDWTTTRLTRHLLQRLGCAVDVLAEMPDAVAAVAARRPDVVLVEPSTPGLGGLATVEVLKRSRAFAAKPVIIVSAQGHADDVLAGYRSGADYYITKPYTPDELLYGMSLCLGRKVGAAPRADATVDAGLLAPQRSAGR
jgi:DNA-binding response OmpR family regulator